MAKSVKIKCKYYQVMAMENGKCIEELYDLRSWLAKMEELSYDQRYKEVKGIKGRLEQLGVINNNIYGLNFMRMDEFSSAYILSKEEPAEHIDINVEEDEYIAKNTVCLYDSDNSIIMMQSNRGSYSEKSIESYINAFLGQMQCSLVPIIENVNLDRENLASSKLDIRLANVGEFSTSEDASFESIINGVTEMGANNLHIEVSVGRSRSKRLNAGPIRKIIRDIMNNRSCVTSAKIKLDDDQITGLYDIFDNFANDQIKCAIDTKGEVSFKTLSYNMYNKYITEGARERIINALQS